MYFLLIDDDQTANFISRKLIERTFESPRVMTAKNSAETLIKLHKKNNDLPNAIFLDINLGIETGWEILDKIKELKEMGAINKIPKVFILSSSIFDGDKQKAKEYDNVLSYISKPLSIDKLEDIKILLN